MSSRAPRLDRFGDEFAWSLLDAVPDGILMATTSGEIVFVNDQMTSLFGGSTVELVGRSVDDLLPEELRGVHRTHRTRYRAEPEVRPMGAGLTLRARRLDGSEFDTEISLSPIRLGGELHVLVAVRDVSERTAAQDHLRRVLGTLDASDDGVFMFDATSLCFTYVNDGAVRLVGYERDELFGMRPLDLNPYATEDEYRNLVDQLLSEPDEHVNREAILLRKDGIEVPVEKIYRAAPLARDGTRWIITSTRDISARLEAEARLSEQEVQLREVAKTIALVEDRDRIARDLHDTVIQRLFGTGLGLQSLMAIVDDPVRGRLERAIDDLDETIRELRSAIFSLQSNRSMTAPNGIREQIIEMVGDVANTSGFESRVRFEGSVESIDPVITDQLIPTVREALSNVAKHANAREVVVRLTVNDFVMLTVTDDGAGVEGEPGGGQGLRNMASRATNLGGYAELRPGPSGGSVLTWSVPADSGSAHTS